MKVINFDCKSEAFGHFIRLRLLKPELAREMAAFQKDVKLSEFFIIALLQLIAFLDLTFEILRQQ